MKILRFASVPATAAAFSASSSFTGSSWTASRPAFVIKNNAAGLVMYENSRDPPSNNDYNAWTILANTEKWISSTLASAGTAAGNPYSRKEVSYVCENANDSAMIVSGIFRRLKKVRERGERHGEEQESRAEEVGDRYEPSTLRETQVIVIPGNKDFSDSFPVFDTLIEAVNQARRNARDYVTDVALEKLDDRMVLDPEEQERDWSVSVNCAHLHPQYGEKTPEQVLEDMEEEEKEGEIDVHLQEYKEKRLQARRSPYPSIVIEVRAVPPPDFGDAPPAMPAAPAPEQEDKVSSADVQRLEALFGKTAHMGHPTRDMTPKQEEEAFYDAIGQNIQEVSLVTPLVLAQKWISENDPLVHDSAAFTESSEPHVDAAYEFIFANIAMMKESGDPKARQYLVMPHFLSSSATSFDKFSGEVQKMIEILPDLRGRVSVSTFHPEHVDASRRSPSPIYVLEWLGGDKNQSSGK